MTFIDGRLGKWKKAWGGGKSLGLDTRQWRNFYIGGYRIVITLHIEMVVGNKITMRSSVVSHSGADGCVLEAQENKIDSDISNVCHASCIGTMDRGHLKIDLCQRPGMPS